jgi:hypothetical protein
MSSVPDKQNGVVQVNSDDLVGFGRVMRASFRKWARAGNWTFWQLSNSFAQQHLKDPTSLHAALLKAHGFTSFLLQELEKYSHSSNDKKMMDQGKDVTFGVLTDFVAALPHVEQVMYPGDAQNKYGEPNKVEYGDFAFAMKALKFPNHLVPILAEFSLRCNNSFHRDKNKDDW